MFVLVPIIPLAPSTLVIPSKLSFAATSAGDGAFDTPHNIFQWTLLEIASPGKNKAV